MSRTISVRQTMRGMRQLARFIDELKERPDDTPVEVALRFHAHGIKPSELAITVPTRRRARTHFA